MATSGGALWECVLDADERARAARFIAPGGRLAFIAAHALTRAALAAVAGAPAAAFGFVAGAHGKPQALLDGCPAAVSFSLAHTDGLVGVAVAAVPFLQLGFDLEPLARPAPMQVARRCFTAAECAWLEGLPEPRRGEGFFRLWTLKEAFIKATGAGLSQDLRSFGFRVDPPAIRFAPGSAERAQDWCFAQRVVHGGFLAALALRGEGAAIDAVWRAVDPAGFDPVGGLEG